MTPVTASPLPGSMTVPPLFGWEEIATLLVALVVLAVVFLLVATTRAGAAERSEWQAWLEARSGRAGDPAVDAAGVRAEGQRAAPGA